MIFSYKTNHEKDSSLDYINSEKINEIEELLSRESKLLLIFLVEIENKIVKKDTEVIDRLNNQMEKFKDKSKKEINQEKDNLIKEKNFSKKEHPKIKNGKENDEIGNCPNEKIIEKQNDNHQILNKNKNFILKSDIYHSDFNYQFDNEQLINNNNLFS
jgi:hypothetical protein